MASRTDTRLPHVIVEFCRFARECGLPAGVKESLDALRAAEAVGIAEREKLKYALRAVICSSKADWDLFTDVFETFWDQTEANARLMQRKSKRAKSSAESDLQQQSEPLVGAGAIPGKLAEGEGQRPCWARPRMERFEEVRFLSTHRCRHGGAGA